MSQTQVEKRSASRKEPAMRKGLSRRHKPIEEILQELASKVPPRAWDRLPHDLPARVDRFLYGGTR